MWEGEVVGVDFIMNRLFLVVFIVAAFFLVGARAQEWRQIQPMVSRCSDVKKLFGLTNCDRPVTNYDSAHYGLNITFTGGKRSRNPMVARVIIVFKKWISLSDLENDLSGYKILPDGDLVDSRIYENQEKGISFTVREFLSGREKYVTSVVVFPKKVVVGRSKTK